MDMWTVGILGYLVFGLLLMDYLCPFWHPFERMMCAIFLPITLIVGVGMLVASLVTKPKPKSDIYDTNMVFIYALAVVMAAKACENLAAENKDKIESKGIEETKWS